MISKENIQADSSDATHSKVCSKCGEDKPIEEYYSRISSSRFDIRGVSR